MPPNKLSGHAVANYIAAISGVITCLFVFVKGGEYTRQVDVNTSRLGLLETAGSPTVQAHIKFDVEQIENIKTRLVRLEDAFVNLGDIRSRLTAIETRLISMAEDARVQRDALSELLKAKIPK